VARVNGQSIRIGQVLGMAKKALKDSKDREKDMPGALRQAMHQYVERELLFQEAMARGISADTKQVETAYDQVRARFKDELRFKESLADQGLDPQSYKQELRVQETVNALLAKAGGAIAVTDAEAKAFFEANPGAFDPGEKLQIRHILFRVPQGATERSREAIRVKAAIAANRAKSGEDFTKLALELSEDPGKHDQGGLLEIRHGMMPPAFDQAAFALQPGQISGLVETPVGLSVIKLEKRIPGPPVPFEDVREPVRSELLHQMRQAGFQSLLSSLRAKARIETYL
jgi:peptidyl-prolyl cis-trans isomerase C